MKKSLQILLIALFFSGFVFIVGRYFYIKSVTKSEPVFWQGAFQSRLNFRDVGESLNQCLGRQQFATDKMFRSNKFFSGWSCEKIHNPDKIYSLNYEPTQPQKYFCLNENDEKQFGIAFNKNFVISDISAPSMWKSETYKQTMCAYFSNALNDLTHQTSFLFHCSVGRDRTGDFAAMLVYMLLEEKHMNTPEMIDALECDYEKTSALEKYKIGHIKDFLQQMQNDGGVKKFIQSQCNISDSLISDASENFILKQ